VSRLAGRRTDQDSVVLLFGNEGEPSFREPAFDLREKLRTVAVPVLVAGNLHRHDAVFVDGGGVDAVGAECLQKLFHVMLFCPQLRAANPRLPHESPLRSAAGAGLGPAGGPQTKNRGSSERKAGSDHV
jgi:hypothetical protein